MSKDFSFAKETSTKETELRVESDSMLIWYPKIKDLPIPQPKTEILILEKDELEKLYEEVVPGSLTEKVQKICDKIGYPCFLRTDLASAKHSWNKSCFIENSEKLHIHIHEVTVFNLIADIMGLDFKALVIRKIIPMDSKFTAFGGKMPVNPERRYFVKDGKVLCHHPYWIEEVIAETEEDFPPSEKNWRELAKEMNTEADDEIRLLTSYAEIVAKRFAGFWSVDFCKAKDGRWVLIDMASGERSWHDKNCEFNPERKRP